MAALDALDDLRTVLSYSFQQAIEQQLSTSGEGRFNTKPLTGSVNEGSRRRSSRLKESKKASEPSHRTNNFKDVRKASQKSDSSSTERSDASAGSLELSDSLSVAESDSSTSLGSRASDNDDSEDNAFLSEDKKGSTSKTPKVVSWTTEQVKARLKGKRHTSSIMKTSRDFQVQEISGNFRDKKQRHCKLTEREKNQAERAVARRHSFRSLEGTAVQIALQAPPHTPATHQGFSSHHVSLMATHTSASNTPECVMLSFSLAHPSVRHRLEQLWVFVYVTNENSSI